MNDDSKELIAAGATAVGKELASSFSEPVKGLLGPACTELGLMLGDRCKEFRFNQAVKIRDRANAKLRARGIQSIEEIPLRLSIPLIEAASLEENEGLAEKWASLLANAADPKFRKGIKLSYVEDLKQLTPESAAVLDCVANWVPSNILMYVGKYTPRNIKHEEVWAKLGLDEDTYRNIIDDLFRLRLLEPNEEVIDGGRFLPLEDLNEKDTSQGESVGITRYGVGFLKACSAITSEN